MSFSCWVVTDGKAGMESQCIGLAEALGLNPVVKRVALRTPWKQLTPYFRLCLKYAFARGSDAFDPPWPDLLIATGRQSVPASLYIRGASGGRTKTVQIQNPNLSPSYFDLIITPKHDRLSGSNILSTFGALHRVTPAALQSHAERLRARVQPLQPPFLGVALGGTNGAFNLTTEISERIGATLKDASERAGLRLLITSSRRTGSDNLKAFQRGLGDAQYFLWEGEGENPYFGILGASSYLCVTADSVNMVSEAASVGAPVYVIDLPSKGKKASKKFARFHESMRQAGFTKPFTGVLEHGSTGSLPDMDDAVARVRAMF